ncbi:GNAT family N-acetyltransferase [Arthrobacter gandavensis]|uniref:GNAT family N-acetyltransferase n=1 Tax=Arthrobacter gandavensis TaxID=169960 RepID=UPI00188E5550|nr:GNAT family N-acetyltransferase [Arthrobacter gandavensis]MBF4995371.1 GNAT family N-acetyltransferase [Arthrobacter gandavensis]
MGIARLEHASAAEISALSAVLAEAFADYAWTRWTVDRERREARIGAIQRFYLEHLALPHGEVWTNRARSAVAVLLPPEVGELAPLTPELQEKLLSLHGASARNLEFVLPQPPRGSWTLATIGVAPAAQGNGLGTRLMETMLAAGANRGIALETSAEQNVAFYRRFGFRVWAVSEMPDGGPPVWSMLRAPGG